ncbi:MAG: translation initiation factor IF-2 [Kofleriaceae bacterium]|nr:translation initiation factor IF-2 [Kofleriaceae bacterium]
MSSDKIRIYELARDIGAANKELVEKALALGFSVKSHMSSLTLDEATKVKNGLGFSGPASIPAAKPAKAKTSKPKMKAKPKANPPTRRKSKAPEESVAKPVAVQPMRRRRPEEVQAAPTPAPVVARAPMVRTPVPPAAPAAVEPTPAPAPVAVTPAPAVVTPAPAAVQAPVVPTPAPAPTPVVATPAPVTPAPVAATPAPTLAVATPAPAAPAPAPIVATPAPVAAVPTPAPAVPTPPPAPSKNQVVVAGPKVINLPGHQKKKAPPAPVVVRAPAPVAPAPAPAAPATPVSAKERFEAELLKARAQAAHRDEERLAVKAEKKAAQESAAPAPADGRPAVGTVIKLPVTRIKVVERPLAAGRGTAERRNRFTKQKQRGRRDIRRKAKPRGPGRQTQITTPAEHKRVVRIEETTTVGDLGKAMGIKSQELLKKLWGMGMVGISLNASIDLETAQLLAQEFHYEVQNIAFKEEDVFATPDSEEDALQPRAPVVTVMGHVDHGKTSLLDYIRKAKVTSGESGGITQHIGAYKVDAGEAFGEMVFIDTPGHAAFTEMRARGAQITDIVVLICAADDGVMPQTVEAVKHAQAAGVPIIVAVNKSDVPGANPERVRQQLSDHKLIPEEWGGDTIYVDCSAKTGDGVDDLLEAISLNAELLDLKADPDKVAVGVVIEARLDRSRGPMSTVLVQEGTLRAGDIVVVGGFMGKVRALMDHNGKQLKEAGPGTPVEILGIDGVPLAGETLNATEDEKMAKQVVEVRRQQKRKKELASSGKVSLEALMSNIQGGKKAEVFKVVLKADVQGSAEALKAALVALSTDKVRVEVIHCGVGGITESDISLAHGNAIVVGFHVRTAGKAGKLADKEGVEIKIYDIIYDALDDVQAAMAGMLAPVLRQVEIGRMEVRETFHIPRRGVVAGCMVTQGRVARKSHLRVIRDSVQVYEGKVSSLRRFKDEASEVKEGFECGIMLDGYNELQEGDVIESFEIVSEKATI